MTKQKIYPYICSKLITKTNIIMKSKFAILPIVAVVMMTMASCGDDEPGPTPAPTPEPSANLISTEVPPAGWSGDMKDGVAAFVPAASGDAVRPYYAFAFSAGVCEGSIYEVVYDNELTAESVARTYDSGTWNPDYIKTDDKGNIIDNNSAVLPALRSGKVIYVPLGVLNGRRADEVKAVVDYWTGASGNSATKAILFGYWDEEENTYACDNAFSLNARYEIRMKFDAADRCTSYAVTVTATSEPWAEMIRESLGFEIEFLEAAFGAAPDVRVARNVLSVDAVGKEPVDRSTVLAHLPIVDWTVNRPYLSSLY